MRLAFAIILLSCVAGRCDAQKTNYFQVAFGLPTRMVKDDAMSPMRYKAIIPQIVFGHSKTKPGRKLSEVRFSFEYGKLKAAGFREYPSMQCNHYRFDFDYVHLRPTRLIPDSTNGRFLFGGSFHSMIAARFHPGLDNSAIVYENFHSIGVSGAYQNTFRWKHKQLYHFHRLDVPVLSYGTRPPYMNAQDVVDPEYDLLAEGLSNGRPGSLGTFARVIISNSIHYPIRGQNRLAFTYEWEFYRATFTETVRAASHNLVLSLLVRI